MSLLSNPMIKVLVKNQLPEILGNLDSAETSIAEYIDSFPLQDGETHTALFTDLNDGKLYFCVGAFSKRTMVRLIEAKPAKEFVKTIIETALK